MNHVLGVASLLYIILKRRQAYLLSSPQRELLHHRTENTQVGSQYYYIC